MTVNEQNIAKSGDREEIGPPIAVSEAMVGARESDPWSRGEGLIPLAKSPHLLLSISCSFLMAMVNQVNPNRGLGLVSGGVYKSKGPDGARKKNRSKCSPSV